MATMNCPSCEQEVPAGTVYCPACARPITAPVTRRPDPKPADVSADPPDMEERLCPAPGCGQPLAEGEELCSYCGKSVERSAEESANTLIFPWGRHTVKSGESVTLGRSHPPFERELAEYGNVGRSHARIDLRDGKLWVIDLASQNGTYIDGKRLPPDSAELLRPGQVLRLAAALEIEIR